MKTNQERALDVNTLLCLCSNDYNMYKFLLESPGEIKSRKSFGRIYTILFIYFEYQKKVVTGIIQILKKDTCVITSDNK